MGGGLGGIFASVAFKQIESPKYTVGAPLIWWYDTDRQQTGIFVTLATSLTSIVLIGIMDLYFKRCNKKARDGTQRIEGMSDWYYTY